MESKVAEVFLIKSPNEVQRRLDEARQWLAELESRYPRRGRHYRLSPDFNISDPGDLPIGVSLNASGAKEAYQVTIRGSRGNGRSRKQDFHIGYKGNITDTDRQRARLAAIQFRLQQIEAALEGRAPPSSARNWRHWSLDTSAVAENYQRVLVRYREVFLAMPPERSCDSDAVLRKALGAAYKRANWVLVPGATAGLRIRPDQAQARPCLHARYFDSSGRLQSRTATIRFAHEADDAVFEIGWWLSDHGRRHDQ